MKKWTEMEMVKIIDIPWIWLKYKVAGFKFSQLSESVETMKCAKSGDRCHLHLVFAACPLPFYGGRLVEG